jgi:hypothetical protein
MNARPLTGMGHHEALLDPMGQDVAETADLGCFRLYFSAIGWYFCRSELLSTTGRMR